MKTYLRKIIGAAFVFLLVGQNASGAEPVATPNSRDDTSQDEISLAELHDFIAANQGWILDVRSATSYAGGHIPGAISLPDTNFQVHYAEVKSKLEADKSRPIVVYCASDSCGGAEWVQARLREKGYRRVTRFRAGWEGWVASLDKGLGQRPRVQR